MKKISDVLFYVSFGYVFALGVAGLYQLIKNKSLKKVDMRLYLLLGAYLLVVVIYFLFEVMKINYSPYIEEKLYASYPSSHVFIGCSFYLLNSYTALKMLKSDKSWVNYLTYILTAVVCALLVFSRSLSLRHWLTDIIASLILVGFIYTLYIHFNHRYIKEEVVSE